MEKRLMRLTWNDNNWVTPTKRPYDISKADDRNTAYEKRFGFGGEDWLFNKRYLIDGYQYGYIRGVNDLVEDLIQVDEAVLFSINPDTLDRHLIATISNLEIIEGEEDIQRKIAPHFRKHFKTTIQELNEVGAYTKEMEKHPHVPNIRFRLTDLEYMGYDIIVNGIKGNRFNRFKPYIITPELEKLLELSEHIKTGFVFKPGKGKLREPAKRKTSLKEREISNTHAQISEALFQYLQKEEKIDKSSISVEKTKVNRKIVDIAVQKNQQYLLFEIKTHNDAISAIREAIGQLLEYALSDSRIKIESIHIVSPGVLMKADKQFLTILKKTISIPLYYWEFYFNPDKACVVFKKF